jgi:hypothetical protein
VLSHHTLRECPAGISYSIVIAPPGIATLEFLYPARRGDSRPHRIASRARAAEAVVGRVGAFVDGLAHFRSGPEDRTLVR